MHRNNWKQTEKGMTLTVEKLGTDGTVESSTRLDLTWEQCQDLETQHGHEWRKKFEDSVSNQLDKDAGADYGPR